MFRYIGCNLQHVVLCNYIKVTQKANQEFHSNEIIPSGISTTFLLKQDFQTGIDVKKKILIKILKNIAFIDF